MLLNCHTLPAISWQQQSAFYAENELAVFGVKIAENQQFVPKLWPLLLADEQQRAQRYHRAADQQRFVIARAALRIILGNYLHCPPADLHFVLGPTKKPALRNGPPLHYNVSHAKDWILLAVSATEIGVDVEGIDPLFPFQQILPHSFSLPERTAIARSPDSAALFYQLWTRKEALVKATAQGIDAEFSAIPALDGPHQVGEARGNEAAPWLVSSFAVADGYVGAVAYQPSANLRELKFYNLGNSLFAGC